MQSRESNIEREKEQEKESALSPRSVSFLDQYNTRYEGSSNAGQQHLTYLFVLQPAPPRMSSRPLAVL